LYAVKKNTGIKDLDPIDGVDIEDAESGIGTDTNTNGSQKSMSEESQYDPDSSGQESDYTMEIASKQKSKPKKKSFPLKRKIEEDTKGNILQFPPLKIPKLEAPKEKVERDLKMSKVSDSYFDPQPGPSWK
jgi:hypothetical protein